ncbi:MAG: Two-component hybrid sensor and regulator [Parcubacteria group bacterium GW2011_GWA1_51_12]|nr:MAG: Two-component hybrid sensor and regulator [Parcubacteria group bacterium GW2011_GWA1_51_12]
MSEQVTNQKKRILIVDDDERLLELHTAMFKDAGFEVLTAGDGEAAWALLNGGTFLPHIVLSGIRMPKLTGFELFQKMRQSPELKSIPVALYSHQGLEEHKRMAESMGVDRFIVRAQTPPGEVVEIIKQILGAPRQFRLTFDRGRFDGADFVRFVDHAEKTHLADTPTQPLFIVIEPSALGDTYWIKLEEEK